jgi:pyrroloquinoline-quinone synthase
LSPEQLRNALAHTLADRQLLDHAFYRRWEAGTLSLEQLGEYAGQYRHFEAALPGILRGILDDMGRGAARNFVERNLADEEGVPQPHIELFAGFARAVKAPSDSPMTSATRQLLDAYGELVAAGEAQGLAALVAYESQAPSIAASKADGLRRHYGLDAEATAFWDVHSTMDEDHAAWAVEALASLPADTGMVLAAACRAADAWWAFLDEREDRVLAAAA